jgi:ferric-dicitrate binding protein FerR (iron transport regulator)
VEKQRLAGERNDRAWTRVEDYFTALARRRTARRKREPITRTQPETPRFSLSTLPFLVLIAALFVIAAAIMVAAWPGAWPEQKAAPAAHELGRAERGWFQEAEKEMNR